MKCLQCTENNTYQAHILNNTMSDFISAKLSSTDIMARADKESAFYWLKRLSYSYVASIVLSLYVLSSLSYFTHECKTSALIHAQLFDNCVHTVQVFIEYSMCLLTYALKTVRQTVEVMI